MAKHIKLVTVTDSGLAAFERVLNSGKMSSNESMFVMNLLEELVRTESLKRPVDAAKKCKIELECPL
jgi:hypothetical protein